MRADTWNPAQYEKFREEREQPFSDLLAMVRPAAAMRIVDLGCGTGRLTRILHERLGARETVGLDRSRRMLDSMLRSDLPEGLRFEVDTIESFAGDSRYDLIFSNAALHWVDDHEGLIPRLAASLAPAGQLAFQVPASHDMAPHLIAAELTTIEPFKTAFAAWRPRVTVLAPEQYARLLYRSGFRAPVVRLVVYPHILQGPEDVVEWMKGTLLTEYERHLPAELFGPFVAEYSRRLLAAVGGDRPFFFPFKRIFCWGQKTC